MTAKRPTPLTWELPSRAVREPDTWELEVPESLGYFSGHFDGLPILPGVVQLQVIARHARARWPELGEVRGVSRGKFKRPLAPGDRLRLTLQRRDGDRVVYRLQRDGEDAATGVLKFASATAPEGP